MFCVNPTLVLLLAALSCGFQAAARADRPPSGSQDGSAGILDGLRALESRQILKARQSFEHAYRSSSIPEALYHLGRVAQLDGMPMLAADLFRRYRDLVGGQIDPPVKAVIDAHLATQKQPVSEVRLAAPDGSLLWLDGQLLGRSPLPGPALLSPGQHQFALETEGGRYVSDRFTIPEGRVAQVNLTLGQRGAAIAIVSLPPAVLLVLSGLGSSHQSSTTEALRSTVSAAIGKEQSVLVSAERLEPLLRTELPDCLQQPDCQDRIARQAEARSILVLQIARSTEPGGATSGLGFIEIFIRDVASRQIATQKQLVCDGCSPAQQLDRLGQTIGGMIAEANNRPRTMIAITSNPPGSSVYVDGQLLGSSPVERMSFAGPHSVKVIKDGYESVEQTVEVQIDHPNSFDFNLKVRIIPVRRAARPTWRLALGGVFIGGGILAAALGVSALTVNGTCDETMPSVVGRPCPQIYLTNGVGGGLLGGGLAMFTSGVIMMAIPGQKLDHKEASYSSITSASVMAFVL